MSLITRCPACGTMFKVVPDQLRISDGWVRCGHCGEVFDARANLHEPEAVAPVMEAPAPSVETSAALPAFTPFSDAPSSADIPIESVFTAQEPTYQTPAPVDSAPAAAPELASGFSGFSPAPASSASEMAASPGEASHPVEAAAVESDWIELDIPLHEDEHAHGVAASYDPTDAAHVAAQRGHRDDEEPHEASEPAVAPAFVRQADRRAFWRRPAVRGLLVLLFLILAVALGLQFAVQERDRIAAQWPETRPLLTAVCEVAGCKVGALRRIDAIAVEGTSFTRLRADAYRLTLLLKNNAALDLAMPSIELTLTDTQDQAIIRRVLSPADMSASAQLAAGAEWNGNVPIAVTLPANAARVAGYRVLAFYP